APESVDHRRREARTLSPALPPPSISRRRRPGIPPAIWRWPASRVKHGGGGRIGAHVHGRNFLLAESSAIGYGWSPMARYIFITGGVVSSLGKGLASAALGALLQARGYTVRLRKLDPYLNIDPGTMSPYQHGEVFVTDDGAETDLDLGHYERFSHVRTRRDNNCTAGRIYEIIITKERRGDYLGKTVQVIPHVTNEIKAAIKKVANDVDVAIVEVGGTVGDIESLPFLEAIRQMRQELGRENVVFVHLTLVPFIQT